MKTLDVLWEPILKKFCLGGETLQMLEQVHKRSCCWDEAYGTQSLDSMMSVMKVMYKSTVNHEPREMTKVIRKGWNKAWLRDNNRSILARD